MCVWEMFGAVSIPYLCTVFSLIWPPLWAFVYVNDEIIFFLSSIRWFVWKCDLNGKLFCLNTKFMWYFILCALFQHLSLSLASSTVRSLRMVLSILFRFSFVFHSLEAKRKFNMEKCIFFWYQIFGNTKAHKKKMKRWQKKIVFF